MNKILLIMRREYLTRVRTKSFIITSLLGPIFMLICMAIPSLIERAGTSTSFFTAPETPQRPAA